MNSNLNDHDSSQDRLPIIGTWRRLYVVVILNLVVLIILFHLFSEAFK